MYPCFILSLFFFFFFVALSSNATRRMYRGTSLYSFSFSFSFPSSFSSRTPCRFSADHFVPSRLSVFSIPLFVHSFLLRLSFPLPFFIPLLFLFYFIILLLQYKFRSSSISPPHTSGTLRSWVLAVPTHDDIGISAHSARPGICRSRTCFHPP